MNLIIRKVAYLCYRYVKNIYINQMRRVLIWCLNLLFCSSICSSAETEFENLNEINISYGLGTSTAFFQKPFNIDNYLEDFDDVLCYEDVTNVDYWHTGAISFSYMRQVSNKVKWGAAVSFERTYLKRYLELNDVPKYYYEELDKAKAEGDLDRQKYLQNYIDSYKDILENARGYLGTSTKTHITILPQVKLTYINHNHWAFYQRYGAGFDIQDRKGRKGQHNQSVGWNICVVPAGFEFGGSYMRGIIEFPAFSPQGFLCLGMKFDF